MTPFATFCSSPPTPILFFFSVSQFWFKALFEICSFLYHVDPLPCGLVLFGDDVPMSYAGPFTIDIVGKAGFNPIRDPNSFSFIPDILLSFLVQLVSFAEADWILCDEKHRVTVKGLGNL